MPNKTAPPAGNVEAPPWAIAGSALPPLHEPSFRLEEGWIATWAYGMSGKAKLLRYDLTKLIRYGAYASATSRGTIFTMDANMIKEVIMWYIVGGIITVAVSFLQDMEEMDIKGIDELSKYLNQCVPFVLALYISLAIQRWWALRTEALAPLFNATSNVLMQLSALFPAEEFAEVKDKTMRYCMASIMLMIKACRTSDSHIKCDDMVQRNYLTPGEGMLLDGTPAKQIPMVLWCWILRLCTELIKDFVNRGGDWLPYEEFQRECCEARNGVQAIHTYLTTQLPFAYVHLITFIVNTNNIVVCVKCALKFSKAFAQGNAIGMVSEGVFLFIVPLLYQGLLVVTYIIHDPFGEDMLDFPVLAYQDYVASTCKSMMDAGSNCPAASHLFPDSPLSSVNITQPSGPPTGVGPAANRRIANIETGMDELSAQVSRLQTQHGDLLRELRRMTESMRDVSDAVLLQRQGDSSFRPNRR
mmetsp:Transcript_17716/g.39047  ORF Transcript_17716/g.39047 Transcript_17716/m.39047 type:complete len:471 (+) Transcript_17716:99-1511(+)